MNRDQIRELSDAFDRQEPDAKRGTLEAYGLAVGDEDVVKVVICTAIELGVQDYDGVLGWLRRAAVGMPVPGEREIQSWRRVTGGAS